MTDNITVGMALLDTDNGFNMFDKTKQQEILYGTFAITLLNTDCKNIRISIAEVINQYIHNGFCSENIEKFALTLYRKIERYISFASKGYLNTKQAHIITDMLTREVLNKIETCSFENTDTTAYMPLIFSEDKLFSIVRNILTREDNDLQKLVEIMGEREISSTLEFIKNEQLPVYYLTDSYDYLLLDLRSYMEKSNKTVKECGCCGRLFLPRRKSDKYCRLPNLEFKHKTCNEIMKVFPNDEYVKLRNKARDKQHKAIEYYRNKNMYDDNFLIALYDEWSEECGKMFSLFKSKEDIHGFRDWIEKTRFSKHLIQQKYDEFQKK